MSIKAKKSYFHNKVTKLMGTNPKNAWSHIKPLIGKSIIKEDIKILYNGNVIDDNADIADIFGNYYQDAIDNIYDSIVMGNNPEIFSLPTIPEQDFYFSYVQF